MALAVKGAAEDGDGPELRSGQVDVRIQIDRLSHGPAVHGAAPGQVRQILGGPDVDRAALRRQGGGRQGPRQEQGQQQRDHALFISGHVRPPPFPSLPCRPAAGRAPAPD